MCVCVWRGRFWLAVYDLRLDKMLVLSFGSGLDREDWYRSMCQVQDTINKGLIPVRTCQYARPPPLPLLPTSHQSHQGTPGWLVLPLAAVAGRPRADRQAAHAYRVVLSALHTHRARSVGKTAEEQEEQANKIIAERRRMGLDSLEVFKSKYSDEERCQMVTSYNHELDENFGLGGYEFAIVMQARYLRYLKP